MGPPIVVPVGRAVKDQGIYLDSRFKVCMDKLYLVRILSFVMSEVWCVFWGWSEQNISQRNNYLRWWLSDWSFSFLWSNGSQVWNMEYPWSWAHKYSYFCSNPQSIISLKAVLGNEITAKEEMSLELLQKLDKKRSLTSGSKLSLNVCKLSPMTIFIVDCITTQISWNNKCCCLFMIIFSDNLAELAAALAGLIC